MRIWTLWSVLVVLLILMLVIVNCGQKEGEGKNKGGKDKGNKGMGMGHQGNKGKDKGYKDKSKGCGPRVVVLEKLKFKKIPVVYPEPSKILQVKGIMSKPSSGWSSGGGGIASVIPISSSWSGMPAAPNNDFEEEIIEYEYDDDEYYDDGDFEYVDYEYEYNDNPWSNQANSWQTPAAGWG